MLPLLTSQQLVKYVHPSGFKLKVLSTEEDVLFSIYEVEVSGKSLEGEPISFQTAISIPNLDEEHQRIITIDGSSGLRRRVICNVVLPYLFTESEIYPTKLGVLSFRKVFANALADAISTCMYDFKCGGEPPTEALLAQKISTWMNTSDLLIDVHNENDIFLRSVLDAVRYVPVEHPMSHHGRVYNRDWIKLIDPTSTSQGNNINLSYRLAYGASIDKGEITRSATDIFGRTIVENGIAVSLNPRRAYLMRTTFEATNDLTNPEEPVVKPRNNRLSGVHLKTAVMHLREYTYEDCIAISQSAADKMRCNVFKRDSFKSITNIKLNVKESDNVNRDTVLAVAEDGTQFRTSKLLCESRIVSIECVKSYATGIVVNSVRFTFCSVYPLETGCKVSNRAATKGVVRVIKDSDMPRLSDGTVIDVCISPESVYGRRAMNFFYEAMAYDAIQDGLEVKADIYSPSPTFKGLVDLGYGEKTQLYYGKKALPDSTFVGTIFWLRLNKHACEAMTFNAGDKAVNQYGCTVDEARYSGQRADMSKYMALGARGLRKVVDKLVETNVAGKERLNSLLKML